MDSMSNSIAAKGKKDLMKIDHNAIEYGSFRKDFYVEVPELARMNATEVEAGSCVDAGATESEPSNAEDGLLNSAVSTGCCSSRSQIGVGHGAGQGRSPCLPYRAELVHGRGREHLPRRESCCVLGCHWSPSESAGIENTERR